MNGVQFRDRYDYELNVDLSKEIKQLTSSFKYTVKPDARDFPKFTNSDIYESTDILLPLNLYFHAQLKFLVFHCTPGKVVPLANFNMRTFYHKLSGDYTEDPSYPSLLSFINELSRLRITQSAFRIVDNRGTNREKLLFHDSDPIPGIPLTKMCCCPACYNIKPRVSKITTHLREKHPADLFDRSQIYECLVQCIFPAQNGTKRYFIVKSPPDVFDKPPVQATNNNQSDYIKHLNVYSSAIAEYNLADPALMNEQKHIMLNLKNAIFNLMAYQYIQYKRYSAELDTLLKSEMKVTVMSYLGIDSYSKAIGDLIAYTLKQFGVFNVRGFAEQDVEIPDIPEHKRSLVSPETGIILQTLHTLLLEANYQKVSELDFMKLNGTLETGATELLSLTRKFLQMCAEQRMVHEHVLRLLIQLFNTKIKWEFSPDLLDFDVDDEHEEEEDEDEQNVHNVGGLEFNQNLFQEINLQYNLPQILQEDVALIPASRFAVIRSLLFIIEPLSSEYLRSQMCSKLFYSIKLIFIQMVLERLRQDGDPGNIESVSDSFMKESGALKILQILKLQSKKRSRNLITRKGAINVLATTQDQEPNTFTQVRIVAANKVFDLGDIQLVVGSLCQSIDAGLQSIFFNFEFDTAQVTTTSTNHSINQTTFEVIENEEFTRLVDFVERQLLNAAMYHDWADTVMDVLLQYIIVLQITAGSIRSSDIISFETGSDSKTSSICYSSLGNFGFLLGSIEKNSRFSQFKKVHILFERNLVRFKKCLVVIPALRTKLTAVFNDRYDSQIEVSRKLFFYSFKRPSNNPAELIRKKLKRIFASKLGIQMDSFGLRDMRSLLVTGFKNCQSPFNPSTGSNRLQITANGHTISTESNHYITQEDVIHSVSTYQFQYCLRYFDSVTRLLGLVHDEAVEDADVDADVEPDVEAVGDVDAFGAQEDADVQADHIVDEHDQGDLDVLEDDQRDFRAAFEDDTVVIEAEETLDLDRSAGVSPVAQSEEEYQEQDWFTEEDNVLSDPESETLVGEQPKK